MQASAHDNSLFKWLKLSLIFLLFFPWLSALSEEPDNNLTFKSFYTIDLSIADEMAPVTANSDALLLLEKNKVSFKNSIIGSQLDFQMSDNLSLVVQGISHIDNEDNLDASINWAYLQYELGNDNSLRAGKFQTPFLKGTELRSIGFSRLWLSPLIQQNGASGFNEYTGVEYLHKVATDYGAWDFQVGVGRAEHGLPFIEEKTFVIGAAQYQGFDYWVRAALVNSDYEISTIDGRLLSDNANAQLASLESEFQLDNFRINIGASAGRADFSPNDQLKYLSIAYQLDQFTPYVYSAWKSQKFESFRRALPANGEQPPQNPPPGPPPQREPEGTNKEHVYGFGVRWNVSSTQAIKFQYRRLDIENNAGTVRGEAPEDANILSVSIEGVF